MDRKKKKGKPKSGWDSNSLVGPPTPSFIYDIPRIESLIKMLVGAASETPNTEAISAYVSSRTRSTFSFGPKPVGVRDFEKDVAFVAEDLHADLYRFSSVGVERAGALHERLFSLADAFLDSGRDLLSVALLLDAGACFLTHARSLHLQNCEGASDRFSALVDKTLRLAATGKKRVNIMSIAVLGFGARAFGERPEEKEQQTAFLQRLETYVFSHLPALLLEEVDAFGENMTSRLIFHAFGDQRHFADRLLTLFKDKPNVFYKDGEKGKVWGPLALSMMDLAAHAKEPVLAKDVLEGVVESLSDKAFVRGTECLTGEQIQTILEKADKVFRDHFVDGFMDLKRREALFAPFAEKLDLAVENCVPALLEREAHEYALQLLRSGVQRAGGTDADLEGTTWRAGNAVASVVRQDGALRLSVETQKDLSSSDAKVGRALGAEGRPELRSEAGRTSGKAFEKAPSVPQVFEGEEGAYRALIRRVRLRKGLVSRDVA